jgi:putative salt-induced outer membrane protein
MHDTGKVAVALFCALISGKASADWSGKGTFGGVLARGNTETETVSAIVDVKHELGRFTYKLGGSILHTVTDGVTSADRWELRGEQNFGFTDRAYVFATLRYENDSFTDYAYQATGAAGYGYRFIASNQTRLEGQLGAGARRAEIRVTDDVEQDVILRGALNYEHRMTDTALIYNRFLVEAGETNTFMQNQLGLEVKINSRFSLGLDYAIRRNTDVLPGTRNSDQVLTANFVYGFE